MPIDHTGIPDHPTCQALWRSIIENPQDTTTQLAFLDSLEEFGEWPPENVNRYREQVGVELNGNQWRACGCFEFTTAHTTNCIGTFVGGVFYHKLELSFTELERLRTLEGYDFRKFAARHPLTEVSLDIPHYETPERNTEWYFYEPTDNSFRLNSHYFSLTYSIHGDYFSVYSFQDLQYQASMLLVDFFRRIAGLKPIYKEEWVKLLKKTQKQGDSVIRHIRSTFITYDTGARS